MDLSRVRKETRNSSFIRYKMTTQLRTVLQRKIRNEFQVEPTEEGSFAVYSPFTFDDGDTFVVMLQQNGGNWLISDRGHTFMHLSYSDVDISKGTRKEIVDEALASHSIQNRDGELLIDNVPLDILGYRVASFLNGIDRIAGVSKLTKEKVRSTFIGDLDALVNQSVPSDALIQKWHDVNRDPEELYIADYYIRSNPPHLVFGIPNNDKCRRATITCLKTDLWNIGAKKLAIFDDQTKIDRKALAQLTDVVDKQFASLGNKDAVGDYLRKIAA